MSRLNELIEGSQYRDLTLMSKRATLPVIPILTLAILGGLSACSNTTHSRTPPLNDDVYHHINDDTAGTYETAGPTNYQPCTWVRSTHNPATPETTIATGTVAPVQHATVTLYRGEWFFSVQCLPWRYIGPNH